MENRFVLQFEGTDSAIRFASQDMANIFTSVARGWPSSVAQDNLELFADVTQTDHKWSTKFLTPGSRPKTRDAVNAICDLIVELNWSRLRHDTTLMCLHAAGVAMGQSLLVLPNGRRAGKSTLTAELARRGSKVFSDDILAVRLNKRGIAEGLATGISPRLRVPLPARASKEFQDWVTGDPGPSNRQYKFLSRAPVARYGTSCPIGAIVTLDRAGEDVGPSFSEMTTKEVLSVLIYQNFGRFAHSGWTLAALAAIAESLPCLKLTYSNFEEAADFLEASVEEGLLASGAVAAIKHDNVPDFREPNPPFDHSRRYQQRVGFECVMTDDEAFVSDANGVGIFRMGPGMLPIWMLLAEPVSSADIVTVLGDAFPEAGHETLARDVAAGLEELNSVGLIEATSN